MKKIFSIIALILASTLFAADSGGVSESTQVWDGIKIFMADTPVSTTASGAITLYNDSKNIQLIDANGSGRNVTLPTPTSAQQGRRFRIVNTSTTAVSLTVKNAAASTIATVAQNQTGDFYWSGSAWVASVYVQGTAGFLAADGSTAGGTTTNQVFATGVTTDSLTGNTATPLAIAAKVGASAIGNAVTVTGGAGNGAFNGGAASITGGASGAGATGAGGAASLVGGAAASTNGAGGAIAVTGGAGAGTGAGGAIALLSGASGAGATGNGGAITATAGAASSTNGTGGAVTLTSGAGAGTGVGGAITFTPGAAGASANAASAGITGTAAAGLNGQAGGVVTLTGGAGQGAGLGGAVSYVGGAGGATNAVGGAASLTAGAGAGTGNGAVAAVTGGASGSGATGNGGVSKIVGGAAASTAGNGGAAQVTGGAATTTGTGGAVTILGGASAGATGTAGAVSIDSGAAAAGTGAGVTLGGTNATKVAILAPLVSTPATVQDISTGNTITIPTAQFTKRLTASAGAATGVIMTAGTIDGQMITLFNVHATNAITMAIAGTSNVADGVSTVISALTGVTLVWDSTSSRWYHQK